MNEQLDMFEKTTIKKKPERTISKDTLDDSFSDFLKEKILDSYDILRLAADMSLEYYHKPLIITNSGGKDSLVLIHLALECLKPNEFEVINSHTTVDAPETVYYIREQHKELEKQGVKCTIQYPRYKDGTFKSMWNLIVKKDMPPTRLARYCCQELKETTVPNRFIATGVRESESSNRRNRDVFATRGAKKSEAFYYSNQHIKEVFDDDKERRKNEGGVAANEVGVYDCLFISKAKRNDDLICTPIYKWLDTDIWTYIRTKELKYNPLYDQGFYRVGCIGCPMSTNQTKDLERYPKIKQNYINAFQRLVDKRKADGKEGDKYGKNWKDGESVYKWWVGDDSIPGQMDIYSFLDKEDE